MAPASRMDAQYNIIQMAIFSGGDLAMKSRPTTRCWNYSIHANVYFKHKLCKINFNIFKIDGFLVAQLVSNFE